MKKQTQTSVFDDQRQHRDEKTNAGCSQQKLEAVFWVTGTIKKGTKKIYKEIKTISFQIRLALILELKLFGGLLRKNAI